MKFKALLACASLFFSANLQSFECKSAEDLVLYLPMESKTLASEPLFSSDLSSVKILRVVQTLEPAKQLKFYLQWCELKTLFNKFTNLKSLDLTNVLYQDNHFLTFLEEAYPSIDLYIYAHPNEPFDVNNYADSYGYDASFEYESESSES